MSKIKHLYIHIPFCNHICHYCSFAKDLYSENRAKTYLDILKQEYIFRNVDFKNLETVYIGGGTPTALSDELLTEFLDFLYKQNPNIYEKTIEINPETLTLSKALILKKYGVNRASVGVQTTDSQMLKKLNRYHNFEKVKEAIKLLKDVGINNISCDLMYSLPSQTLQQLKEDLINITSLDINHISIYSLQIEEKTPFYHLGYQNVDSELEADMYELIVSFLKKEGFVQYEVANFAKNNNYSNHNLGYWKYNDFYGVGLGASGKINSVRYDNNRIYKKYINGEFTQNTYNLELKDLMFEHIMMSFRTIFGLDLKDFKNRYNCDFFEIFNLGYQKNIDNFILKDNFLICNKREILNEILIDFM